MIYQKKISPPLEGSAGNKKSNFVCKYSNAKTGDRQDCKQKLIFFSIYQAVFLATSRFAWEVAR
jgi:hypothetical protein